MKKATKITVAAILILGVATSVYAYGAHHHWNMSPEEKAEFVTDRIIDKLELDANQQQGLHDLAGTLIEIMDDARANHDEHMDLVQRLISAPTLDQAQALEMIRQKTQLINEKAPQAIASLAGFLDSLNEDQKTKLGEFAGRRMEHHYRH